ncbi:uncharacterized protein LOC114357456 [Ostrinia furnacalis]|uniref:uncharacterized protein LOC114357456 n=1 Tax=Ostrinia furnacalis TaxID=93504 RepID=UPI00104005B5|nr:uncharacterized protein LOC114357456 [Ostrinia furnacalis]
MATPTVQVATYVFIDLETTGLPKEENNRTKITEISMVAVKRDHLLDTRPGAAPRVQHKLTLCLNPGRMIHPDCTKVTGLCNDLLEYEPDFNINVFNMINTFLNVLSKPVCLIAQNGAGFDFPILKCQVEKLKVAFSEDLLCADCYHGFFDIMEAKKSIFNTEISKENAQTEENGQKLENSHIIENGQHTENVHTIKNSHTIENEDKNELYTLKNTLHMKLKNESTPQTKHSGNVTPRETNKKISKARRRFPWSEGSKLKDSYKLKDIYERLLNRPPLEAHRAENDCILALECSVALGQEFVQWVDKNYFSFAKVVPMTPGVPLGS